MNPIDLYLQEFEQESATTRRLIESVPESRYDWRAHEKGMSLGELCAHLASLPEGMPEVLGGARFDILQRPGPDRPPKDRAEILARFDAATRKSMEWLSGLGPRAGETWKASKGDEELMAMPRAMAIRFFLLNHLYHHRGQLSAYLRAAGEKVPSVYGPTADENPFG